MFRTRSIAPYLLATFAALLSCGRANPGGTDPGNVPGDESKPILADLTFAPNVPPPTHRSFPARVKVDIDVKEMVAPIADGTTYTFWTFGGHVPGPFIRVRQGDTVEMHLRNAPTNKMAHNIDLHAVSGPGGGAPRTFVAPGHQTTFSFEALRAGLFVYHCATAPVGMHIANGMYGLILVEPKEGLPPVDREFYVMQGDFYTTGATNERGAQTFDMQKAIDEKPTYVLFNGAEGSLTGANALHASVGQRVRIYLGNGGPNLVSSFHVIGEIFDRVYREGGITPDENVQTTLIPSGGAAMVEFTPREPGDYTMLDHSIFRAFSKGAIGTLQVDGAADTAIYSDKGPDLPFNGTDAPAPANVATPVPQTKEELIAAGQGVFGRTCISCHQATGLGLPPAIPPLAGSDFLMADKERSIRIVLGGLKGPVTVKGQTFSSMEMPSHVFLSDADVAAALTYARSSWGNSGDAVTPAEVSAARAQGVRTVLASN